jgi:hypothetical protein
MDRKLVVIGSTVRYRSQQALHRTIGAVWRIESARVIAGLTRLTRDIGLAEDLAQEAPVAALEQWPQQKRHDFRSFLEDVLADQPQDKEIHVILDNYCTHKKNDDWPSKFEVASTSRRLPPVG